MIYDWEKIGKRILKERKEAKMNQEDFGEIFGVTRRTVTDWEHGKSMPNFQIMLDMCKEFNCELGYLLCEDGYENKTRAITDICKETGLSEEAVKKLQGEVVQLQRINKSRMRDNYSPLKHTTITGFVSYFLVNSQSIFDTIDDFKHHERNMAELRSSDYFELVKEAFSEVQEEENYFFFDAKTEEYIAQNREEHFYYLLEDLLDNYFLQNKPSSELREFFERGDAILPNGEDPERIFEMLDKSDPVEDILPMLQYGYKAYKSLEMEQKKKYFKYEISDIFMDIVKAYLKKEGEEYGRKNKL